MIEFLANIDVPATFLNVGIGLAALIFTAMAVSFLAMSVGALGRHRGR